MPGVWGTPGTYCRRALPCFGRMVEFRNQDLSGSVFDDVDLTGARFINVLLRDVTIRGAWAERLEHRRRLRGAASQRHRRGAALARGADPPAS